MQRIIGAVFIMAGSTGIGFYYKQRFHTALWHLHYMKQIMERFISEIRYDKATLPECCRRVGERAKEPYRTALLMVYEEMQKEVREDFSGSWKKIMGKAVKDLPLKAEEKRPFLEFAENQGLTDNLMQIKILEQYKEMLEIPMKNRETDLEKQGRMASGLGIMGGLLLTILLF